MQQRPEGLVNLRRVAFKYPLIEIHLKVYAQIVSDCIMLGMPQNAHICNSSLQIRFVVHLF